MFRTASSILVVFLFLAGCAGEQPGLTGSGVPRLAYSGPDDPPAKPIAFTLNGSVEDVVSRLVRALDGPRFGITHVDQDNGLITAVYRADPAEFLDCGLLDMTSGDGETSQAPAASRRLRYQIPLKNSNYGVVNRAMQLDGRMIIQVEQQNANQSRVVISGDYVVTRTLRLSGKPGDPTMASRQSIDFGSGQIGDFDQGKLKCQSNGELESYLLASLRSPGDRDAGGERLGPAVDPNAPLLARVRRQFDQLSCAPLNARSLGGQDVAVTGFVSSEDDLRRLQSLVRGVAGVGEVTFRISVISPAFCDILDVTVPLKESNGIDQAGAFVSLADGTFDLVEGDYLVVDATSHKFESYVYLSYAQQDGKLIHLLPNPDRPDNLLPANQSFRVGDDPDARRYSIAGPFGDDMVILIASTEPLFADPRPEIEPTAELARALADRVAEAKAAGADIVADIVFVKTTPRVL